MADVGNEGGGTKLTCGTSCCETALAVAAKRGVCRRGREGKERRKGGREREGEDENEKKQTMDIN